MKKWFKAKKAKVAKKQNNKHGKWFRIQFAKFVARDEIFKASLVKCWFPTLTILATIIFLPIWGFSFLSNKYGNDLLGQIAIYTVIFGMFAKPMMDIYFEHKMLKRKHISNRNRRSTRQDSK